VAIVPFDEERHKRELQAIALRQGEEIYRNSRTLAMNSLSIMSNLEEVLDLLEKLKPKPGFRAKPEVEDAKPERKAMFARLEATMHALDTATSAVNHWKGTGNILGTGAGDWLEKNSRLDYVVENLTATQVTLSRGQKSGESALRLLEMIQELENAIDSDVVKQKLQARQQVQNKVENIMQGIQETLSFINTNRQNWKP
jgi:hypothetical protein